VDDLPGCAHLHEAAVLHDRHAVAKADRLVQVVGDKDDGLLELPLQPQKLILHLPPDEGVQAAEGFIPEHDVRVVG